MDSLTLLRMALLYGLVPAWVLLGLADYLCHRAQHIEETAGLHESLLHLAMLAALAVGVLTVLCLQMNAATLWIVLGACVLHEVLMLADLRWAQAARGIPWYEQWVHGLQQAMPWMALGALMLLHPGQALAMVGLRGRAPSTPTWDLVWQPPPLPAGYLAAFLAGGTLLVGLPFLEEALRCWRVDRRQRRTVPAWKVL